MKQHLLTRLAPFLLHDEDLEDAPTVEVVGSVITAVSADETVIACRSIPRPEFAFETQQSFSLDMEDAGFLSQHDFLEYEQEEFTAQLVEKKKRHRT